MSPGNRILFFFALAAAASTSGHSFFLMSSRTPPPSTPRIARQRDTFKRSLQRAKSFAVSATPSTGGGVSSSLISQLAVVALKLRLKAQTSVECDVTSRSSDLLLRGTVGPVQVKGRGWQSGLGLTCRAIEASVDTCELDVGRILSDRKLRLTRPSAGKAMVALNANDFGNFITHPLLKKAASGIEFVNKHDIHIDASESASAVTFFAKQNETFYRCRLGRNHDSTTRRAYIRVSRADDDSLDESMTKFLSNFFNDMVFELDGTFLSFRDMMITDKGESPSIMLALSITVHKFPSPGLEF